MNLKPEIKSKKMSELNPASGSFTCKSGKLLPELLYLGNSVINEFAGSAVLHGLFCIFTATTNYNNTNNTITYT
jgi:hypothetical protein